MRGYYARLFLLIGFIVALSQNGESCTTKSQRLPAVQDSTATRASFFHAIDSAIHDNVYTKNLSKDDVGLFEKERFLIQIDEDQRSDTLVMHIQSIGQGDNRNKKSLYFVLEGHKFFIEGSFPKELTKSIRMKRYCGNIQERNKVARISENGCEENPGVSLECLYDMKNKRVVDVIDHSIPDIYYVAEENPEYQGGWQALSLYIQEKSALLGLKGDEGGVVRFIVEKDGTLSNIHVVKCTGKVDKTILVGIVRNMPLWVPAKHHGIPCRMVYFLPIGITTEK